MCIPAFPDVQATKNEGYRLPNRSRCVDTTNTKRGGHMSLPEQLMYQYLRGEIKEEEYRLLLKKFKKASEIMAEELL